MSGEHLPVQYTFLNKFSFLTKKVCTHMKSLALHLCPKQRSEAKVGHEDFMKREIICHANRLFHGTSDYITCTFKLSLCKILNISVWKKPKNELIFDQKFLSFSFNRWTKYQVFY